MVFQPLTASFSLLSLQVAYPARLRISSQMLNFTFRIIKISSPCLSSTRESIRIARCPI